MPATSRPLAEGSAEVKSRMHYFMGSGIPKHDTLAVERLDGLAFNFDAIIGQYRAEDSITLMTTVTNKFAGHRVPTGDPERFIITKLSIMDLSNENIVASDSFRIGEHWEWYPEAKKLSDNNLNPGESRIYKIKAKLEKGTYEFILKSYKYRTTEEMVVYNKLGDSYPTHIQFFEKTFTFEVK